MLNNHVHETTLKEWFEGSHSANEKRELFLYVDFAMKYVHERGYCVMTFNPSEIEIIDDKINQVKFNTLLKMPEDDPIYQHKLENEDIVNSAMLQILLYSEFPLNTKREFVKEHFDEFVTFLPSTDVQYYRGVIERGASVYFTEFELERIKRDNEALEQQIKDMPNSDEFSGKQNADLSKMFSNDKINNAIYKKINKLQDSAFINILIYPTVFIVLALVFTFICFILRYLGV